jgi:diadenosine tetraphosphate (Ap4A) HIT family hydrolase
MEVGMPNATMRKFGYPTTLVAETARWAVLVRPQQVTLGALVLVCRDPVRSFGDASPESFAELKRVVQTTETMAREFVAYQKINYLMLMMVDPDVHFHVIPRYEGERRFADIQFPDAGWPGPPALDKPVVPDQSVLAQLVAALRSHWRAQEG